MFASHEPYYKLKAQTDIGHEFINEHRLERVS